MNSKFQHDCSVSRGIKQADRKKIQNHITSNLSIACFAIFDKNRPISNQNPLERFKNGRCGQLSFSPMIVSNLVNFYLIHARVNLAPYPSEENY
ncbi:hypothetical protein [Pseudomonas bohemica]|uniref:hypothetical protein n=1 Tax=Pseudomonas bohemica TaxID=2044872 RepID=UPI0018FE9E11|nr:hypothetical protein [Pseudomonas bohemica]